MDAADSLSTTSVDVLILIVSKVHGDSLTALLEAFPWLADFRALHLASFAHQWIPPLVSHLAVEWRLPLDHAAILDVDPFSVDLFPFSEAFQTEDPSPLQMEFSGMDMHEIKLNKIGVPLWVFEHFDLILETTASDAEYSLRDVFVFKLLTVTEEEGVESPVEGSLVVGDDGKQNLEKDKFQLRFRSIGERKSTAFYIQNCTTGELKLSLPN